MKRVNHWVLEKAPIDAEGFIYKITNNITKKFYIGKKSFWSSKKTKSGKISKSKKNRKESDWRRYKSSCDLLLNDIKELGVSNFTFTILFICGRNQYSPKNYLSYKEIEYQIKHQCLLNENCYNTVLGSTNIYLMKKEKNNGKQKRLF